VGGVDLVLDRLLPYTEPLPVWAHASHIDVRMTCIDICAHLFIEHSPEDDRFPDMFDSLFRRVLLLMSPTVPSSLVIHGFRTANRLLSASKFRFGSEQYLIYWSTFVEICVVHPMLRPMIIRVVCVNAQCGYSVTQLARVMLDHDPDHETVILMAECLAHSTNRQIEKSLLVLQGVVVLAVTNEIMARTCCRALPLLITAVDGVIPWLITFIRKAAGFVVMAQTRRECACEVGLVFELFTALYRTQMEWIQSELSTAAAMLLASQKVSMAIVAGLKPAVRFDLLDLQQWESEAAKGSAVSLSSMLSSVKEEPLVRVVRPAARPVARLQPSPKIVSLSIDISPRNLAIVRTRTLKRALVKPNRFVRGSPPLAL
jgi:hypothetical protein